MSANINIGFTQEDCPNCGIIHFVPKDFQDRRSKDKQSFYCPNGHSASYRGSTVERELRDRIEAKDREIARMAQDFDELKKKRCSKKKRK